MDVTVEQEGAAPDSGADAVDNDFEREIRLCVALFNFQHPILKAYSVSVTSKLRRPSASLCSD